LFFNWAAVPGARISNSPTSQSPIVGGNTQQTDLMIEKKYQIFVSSTYADLQEERKEIIQALLELECIPVGMEMFPATNDDQWTLIKRLIDDCDYYILIMGGRYGSLSKEGISYTQMEYEYAINQSIPIISFIHSKPENIPTGKSEKNPDSVIKLQEFRKKVEQKLCKYWDSPTDLGSKVSRSLIRLIKDYPRDGWVKATYLPTEDASKEILELKRQIEYLNKEVISYSENAPKGSEFLEQGADKIQIEYSYTTTSRENSFVISFDNEVKYETKTFTVNLTWDELFKTISPLMIDETNESSLKEKLLELCRNKNGAIEIKETAKMTYKKYFNTYLNDNSFNQIKVQLRALGLIMKSEKKRSIKDSETYWCLTSFGDLQMTKLIARRK
jgi:Domain of unknown function (DUF4062)